MASAYGVGEESFLSHVERVRSEIHTKFIRAHELLQAREADLLAELQTLVDEYTGEGIAQQIKELSESMDALRKTIKGNENREILDQSLANFDTRIAELETKLRTAKYSYKSVSLEWDVELERKLSVAGEIRLNAVKEGIRDYKEIGDPVAVFGKHFRQTLFWNNIRALTSVLTSSPGVFCYPNGIAINPVKNSIYICDGGNHRVQVYNKSFGFEFQFSEEMNSPAGICIKHNKVFVTQFSSHCLNVYSTKGKYLSSAGVKGKKGLEFDEPRGLDISTEKYRIYIAEYENDRIQCLNLNLTFNSFIDDIYGAMDVKLTSNEIVVLSLRNSCVSLYTYSHQLIREMIPRGEGNPIVSPFSFILDEAASILITDFENNCVSVFSFGGDLIHRFGRKGEKRGEFIEPMGIAIDYQKRIIVGSQNPNHCLQIF